MRPIDIKLQAAVIRYVRGILQAWEEWLFVQAPAKEGPDPVKHFEEIAKPQARPDGSQTS